MSGHTNNNSQEMISYTRQQLLILNKFRKRLEKEKYINNYASNYYGSMHNRFSIPGIIVSGVSSIASFLATSDIISDTGKTAISIGVGILAAGSTIIYSIANSYGFQSRRDSFQMSADAYDDLITRIEFEFVNPNENFNEFCNSLETQILKIKTDCKYLPPLFIYKMYEEESRKIKLAGLSEEPDASLDLVMVDSSPTHGGGSSTTSSPSNINTYANTYANTNNKKIKLPSTITPLTICVTGQQEAPPATYFNDLTNNTQQQSGLTTGPAITMVNKLSASVFGNPELLSYQDTQGEASINLTNMDSADLDGSSFI